MEEKNLIRTYFQKCNAINKTFDSQIDSLVSKKKEELDAVLNEFVQNLKLLLPLDLLQKVEKDFSFEKEDDMKRQFLKRLILQVKNRPADVTFLRGITLNEEDLLRLNKLWSPMIHIDPIFKEFRIKIKKS